MRKILFAGLGALALAAALPPASAQVYQSNPTAPPPPRAYPAPAPAPAQVQAYPQTSAIQPLHNALRLLQQAESELRTAALDDDDHRDEAVEKVREAIKETERSIREDRPR